MKEESEEQKKENDKSKKYENHKEKDEEEDKTLWSYTESIQTKNKYWWQYSA
jgi:hypothetical protein